MSNSLDPDQTWHFAGPDLGLNCLQSLSADDKICSGQAELKAKGIVWSPQSVHYFICYLLRAWHYKKRAWCRAILKGPRGNTRVKPGFLGWQGSSDRSFYVSFTALLTDTCSERSYPFVFATNLLSDTALKICIARVITLCSHWIKASSKKHALF